VEYEDTGEIEVACLELARSTKWSRKPIDAAEITALAARFTEIAQSRLSEALDRNPALVARAIRYIDNAHAMPSGDDAEWFFYMLEALLEVARPNTGLNQQSKAFLDDMVAGIEIARHD
jgi:hypothetical protein